MHSRKKIIFVGLSLSSSWGNGHATTYRALIRALSDRGHDVLFLECDRPWYADHRDLAAPEFCRLAFYNETSELACYSSEIRQADAVIVGSYVVDGTEVAIHLRPLARLLVFYDIDTPVTVALLARGECDYVSPAVIPLYDLYLSFTGGPILDVLERRYHAMAARPLYCAVDPNRYFPSHGTASKRWDLGYLGTYSPDRQPKLETLLLDAARRAPSLRFVVAGPCYPDGLEWPANVERVEHLPPSDHAEFYNDQRWTLNVTRIDMVAAGFSPSVRIFEASACATPIMSDDWAGLGNFLTPEYEIMVVRTTADVLANLNMADEQRQQIGKAARARTIGAQTADHRARELETYLDEFSQQATRIQRSWLSLDSPYDNIGQDHAEA